MVSFRSSALLRCLLVPVLLSVVPTGSKAAQDSTPSASSLSAIDLDAALTPDQLVGKLAAKRVVFVGENHERYDNHLNQLEIIRKLYAVHPDLAIGVEYLQKKFQQQADDYIAGKTTEQEFLRSSDYYPGWGFDYRLYAPIFRYAREHHIPVRALNVPRTLTPQVARSGLSGLTAEQRVDLPAEIIPADEAYKARMREAFAEHGPSKPGAFDRFVEAQLVWDEGMADSAAAWLNANPERHMVILAGSGHFEFGDGIPKRLERRTHASYSIVLNAADEIQPGMADYILLTKSQDLPPAGVLGISLESKDGEALIRAVSPGSAAEKAGLKKGDVLAELDGKPVKDITDMRLALWDKKPGDHARVTIRHKGRFSGGTKTLDIELAAAPKRGA